MLKKLAGMIKNAETVSYIGKIENVVGMAIEASGSRASATGFSPPLPSAGTNMA